MRKLLLILGILTFIKLVYIGVLNNDQMLTLTFKPFIDTFTINSGVLYILLGMLGALGAFFICYYIILGQQDTVKKLLRGIEKASIDSQDNSDKVKALKAKVDTLETALKELLNKK